MKIKEAQTMFGNDVVNEVVTLMSLVEDPDSIYTIYEDMGQYSHAECVSFLYFDEE